MLGVMTRSAETFLTICRSLPRICGVAFCLPEHFQEQHRLLVQRISDDEREQYVGQGVRLKNGSIILLERLHENGHLRNHRLNSVIIHAALVPPGAGPDVQTLLNLRMRQSLTYNSQETPPDERLPEEARDQADDPAPAES